MWDDTFDLLLVDGFAAVALGSGDVALNTTMLSTEELWPSTSVGGQVLGERQRLTHVPRAAIADAVPAVAGTNDAECVGQPGRLAWNTTIGTLVLCDGTTWRAMGFGSVITTIDGARQYSDGTNAVSCNAYRLGNNGRLYQGETGDGVYWVDPDAAGPGAPFRTMCDQNTGSRKIRTA